MEGHNQDTNWRDPQMSDAKHRQVDEKYTLWLFNIAMENDPFIDDFPIKTSIYNGFSMAMLNNQMVLS